jgi:hypothetical protein
MNKKVWIGSGCRIGERYGAAGIVKNQNQAEEGKEDFLETKTIQERIGLAAGAAGLIAILSPLPAVISPWVAAGVLFSMLFGVVFGLSRPTKPPASTRSSVCDMVERGLLRESC